MKIQRVYLEDKEFDERFNSPLYKNSTAVCHYRIWGKEDIIIYIRSKAKDRLFYLIPLLIHEYIHALLYMIFGWNFKLYKIQEVFNYINEVIWVIIRGLINIIYTILKEEKEYFKEYWVKE